MKPLHVKNIVFILVYADTVMPELFLTLVSLVWGVWNLTPFVNPKLGLNGQLGTLLPVWMWSLGFIACAMLALYGLFLNSRSLRRAATLLMAFLWLNVALASIVVGGAGAASFVMIAIERVWIFLRLNDGFNVWLQKHCPLSSLQ